MAADRWQGALAYDRFMGRWSRRLAPEFLEWLDVPPGSDWLEIGCGTGALTEAILEHTRPRRVTACDTSADFVRSCAEQLADERLETVVATVETMPAQAGGYGAVVSSLVLNFLPDPVAGLTAMREAASPARGQVAACVWDYAEGMEFLRRFWDAAVELDSGAAAHHEGRRFPLCRPQALRAAFLAAGLDEVAVTALSVRTTFADFDDFWAPLADGPGPAPSYVASLDESRRGALAALLRERLAPEGGPIDLPARAWAVRGVRAGTKEGSR